MDDGAVIDRLFDALARGDVAAARGCCQPDVRIWHSFDGIALGLDAAAAGWDALATHFSERTFVDVEQQPVGTGFLRRHMMVARPVGGTEAKAWAICMLIQVRDGLIGRLDEYIDRAGALSLPDGARLTPGLHD